MKKALITGVTGQDGSYLSELLIEKGYDVHGIIRRSSVDFRERISAFLSGTAGSSSGGFNSQKTGRDVVSWALTARTSCLGPSGTSIIASSGLCCGW